VNDIAIDEGVQIRADHHRSPWRGDGAAHRRGSRQALNVVAVSQPERVRQAPVAAVVLRQFQQEELLGNVRFDDIGDAEGASAVKQVGLWLAGMTGTSFSQDGRCGLTVKLSRAGPIMQANSRLPGSPDAAPGIRASDLVRQPDHREVTPSSREKMLARTSRSSNSNSR